ncbi:hypothetical protein ACSLBF_09355 [Pseudoalteromonas sp. T1lg65]|uniref:hypothetical protein n=1 Tax=Pseudoalteromonas sp. T1lg65 TaxID=2077101 RepID=UPI003F7B2CAB
MKLNLKKKALVDLSNQNLAKGQTKEIVGGAGPIPNTMICRTQHESCVVDCHYSLREFRTCI